MRADPMQKRHHHLARAYEKLLFGECPSTVYAGIHSTGVPGEKPPSTPEDMVPVPAKRAMVPYDTEPQGDCFFERSMHPISGTSEDMVRAFADSAIVTIDTKQKGDDFSTDQTIPSSDPVLDKLKFEQKDDNFSNNLTPQRARDL